MEKGKRWEPLTPFCPFHATASLTVIFQMILIVPIAPKHPCDRDRWIDPPGRLC